MNSSESALIETLEIMELIIELVVMYVCVHVQ